MRRDDFSRHRIAPGIRGWLEHPSSARIARDWLIASGWTFASESRITDLWVEGLGARRSLRYGLQRDDVARAYGDHLDAAHSGFSGYFEFAAETGERVNFEIWASMDDGRSVRLFHRQLVAAAPASKALQLMNAAREAIRHPRLLLSARSWAHALAMIAGSSTQPMATAAPPLDMRQKHALTERARAVLAGFLGAGSRLTFPPVATPVVSVVVVVWNRADLTLKCLRSMLEHVDVGIEVIVVDNASTDETPELLARIAGATVLRNATNPGFTISANLGAQRARGEFLLFLNNDAELVPGCIAELVKTAGFASSIGAVGGKLVYPDGRLQEAGSIIWSDGSCDAYGRGGDPGAPEYNFERQVDFCSGALLLTRRAVFEQLGGFDERYRPAYYEDADYCARLWTYGYSVVYQPKALAIHYEFGSATSPETSIALQRERRPVFVARHGPWLSSQPSRAAGALSARSHPHAQPSVIVVDDAAPDPRMGAGFPRAAALLEALRELGYLVTIYTTGEEQPVRIRGIEVVAGGVAGLRSFFAARRGHHAVIVSRPHNMQYVKAALGADLAALGAPCVYDAEALYALREAGRRRVMGSPLTEADTNALIDAETALTSHCAAVLTVSDDERRRFTAAGTPHVFVVGHAVQPQPTPSPFDRRRAILFVGAFGAHSPNHDAVRFFCGEILPILRAAADSDVSRAPVVVAGANIPEDLKALGDPNVSWQSDVDDVSPLYDAARVFVAPTRFAAGIPLKIIAAAAHGVPVVCTTLVQRQLGWDAGNELLVADTAADFAAAIARVYGDPRLWSQLRDAALSRVTRDCSPDGFRTSLSDALESARDARR